jgi:hypothetical protein
VKEGLSSIDRFVLSALLDNAESVETILDNQGGAAFHSDDVVSSLRRLIAIGLVDRVEFNQENKTWSRFKEVSADIQKDWFDLTEPGRTRAVEQQDK